MHGICLSKLIFSFISIRSIVGQTCKMQSDKDILGKDYYNVPNQQQTNCCKLCYQSYYCKAVSWTEYSGGTCWLKYDATPAVDVSSANLNTIDDSNANPNSVTSSSACRTAQTNSDIVGNDLENRPNQPMKQCCKYCAQTTGCQAYAWNNYRNGTCWLKSSRGPVVNKPGVSIGTLCNGGTCSSNTRSENVACGSGWQLLKQYNFNNMNQVLQDWNVMVWRPGFVNNELQSYTNSSDNIFIRNNNLVIKALYSGSQITSGRLESKQIFSPKHVPGNKLKVEFTATVPAAMGAWPALWMLGANGQYGPEWPYNGEMDVMEWVWQLQNEVKSALHWKSASGVKSAGRDFKNFVNIRELSSAFITYGVEYSTVIGDQYIQFFIRKPDGRTSYAPKVTPAAWKSTFAGNCQPNCPPMAPFDAKMNLIMNLAIGGDWGGCCGVQGYGILNKGIEMKISAVNVCVLQ